MPIEQAKTDSMNDSSNLPPTNVAFFVTLQETKDEPSTSPTSINCNGDMNINPNLNSNCSAEEAARCCQKPSSSSESRSMKSKPKLKNPDEEIASYIPNSELCCDSLDCPKAQYCLSNNTTDGIPSYLECISEAMANGGANEEVDTCCGNIKCAKKYNSTTAATTTTTTTKTSNKQPTKAVQQNCDEYFSAFVPGRNRQGGFNFGCNNGNARSCDHHDDSAACYFENFSGPTAPSCSSSSCRRAELFGSYIPNSKDAMIDEAQMQAANAACQNCKPYRQNPDEEVPSYIANTCSSCFTEDNCASCQRPINLRDPNYEVATYIPYSSCSSSAVYNNAKAACGDFGGFHPPRVCRTHDDDGPSYVANECHSCFNVPKQSTKSYQYPCALDNDEVDDVPSFIFNSPNCKNCSYIFMPCDDHYDDAAEDYGASYLPNSSRSSSCTYFHVPPKEFCKDHEEDVPSYIPSSSAVPATEEQREETAENVKDSTSSTVNPSATTTRSNDSAGSCEKSCCSNGEQCRIPNASSEDAIPSYIPSSASAAPTGASCGKCSNPKKVEMKTKVSTANTNCASCKKRSAHVHTDDEEIASYIPSGTPICNEHRPSTRRMQSAPSVRSTTCRNTCRQNPSHAIYPGMRRVVQSAPPRRCLHREDEVIASYVPSDYNSCSTHNRTQTMPSSCVCPPSNKMGMNYTRSHPQPHPQPHPQCHPQSQPQQHRHRKLAMPRCQCPQKLRRYPRVPVRKIHTSCQNSNSMSTRGQNIQHKCNSKPHQSNNIINEGVQNQAASECCSDSELIDAVIIETLNLLA